MQVSNGFGKFFFAHEHGPNPKTIAHRAIRVNLDARPGYRKPVRPVKHARQVEN